MRGWIQRDVAYRRARASDHALISLNEAEGMSKLKKQPGSRPRFALGDWFIVDANELSWIAVAIAAVLLYAYNTGG